MTIKSCLLFLFWGDYMIEMYDKKRMIMIALMWKDKFNKNLLTIDEIKEFNIMCEYYGIPAKAVILLMKRMEDD